MPRRPSSALWALAAVLATGAVAQDTPLLVRNGRVHARPGAPAVVASVLVEGVGPTDGEAATEGPRSFVRVFVYQRNVERNCGALEQLEEEISSQVAEEVRHLLHGPSAEDEELGRPSGEPN